MIIGIFRDGTAVETGGTWLPNIGETVKIRLLPNFNLQICPEHAMCQGIRYRIPQTRIRPLHELIRDHWNNTIRKTS